MMEEAIASIIKPCPKCGGGLECPDGWIFNRDRIVGTKEMHPNSIFLCCSSCDFKTPSLATTNKHQAKVVSHLLIRYWNEHKGENNEELLPCPLCGGKGFYKVEKCREIERIRYSYGRYGTYHARDFFRHYVKCDKCTHSTTDIIAASKDGGFYSTLAQFTWNLRPTYTTSGGASWL